MDDHPFWISSTVIFVFSDNVTVCSIFVLPIAATEPPGSLPPAMLKISLNPGVGILLEL